MFNKSDSHDELNVRHASVVQSVIRWLIRSVCTYTQIIFHHYMPAVYSQQFFFSWSHAFSHTASPFWHVKMPFNICYFWVSSCCSLKLTRELFWPCPRPVSSLREGYYSFSALRSFSPLCWLSSGPGWGRGQLLRRCSGEEHSVIFFDSSASALFLVNNITLMFLRKNIHSTNSLSEFKST